MDGARIRELPVVVTVSGTDQYPIEQSSVSKQVTMTQMLAYMKSTGACQYALSTSYISGTGIAGVDNTAQVVKSITISANTLTQVGDRCRIKVFWTGTTGSPITGNTTVNGILTIDNTDAGAATLQLSECWLHYIDATHANIISLDNGTLHSAVSAPNVAGFNWAADQTIAISQDAIANNHIIVYCMIVDIYPRG
jgi:hypothetical protein